MAFANQQRLPAPGALRVCSMKVTGLNRSFAVWIFGAVIGVGVSSAASAQSLEERASGADSVVVATPRSVSASWKENEHGDRIIVSLNNWVLRWSPQHHG